MALRPEYDLVVVGAGPAGAAAAITAARRGARVLLLERGRYPRHKVCGEFVSPESLDVLASLLGNTTLLSSAPRVRRARLFLDGREFTAELAPPAASIARFALDAALWRAAEATTAECRQQTSVDAITRVEGAFQLRTTAGDLLARAVVDASGRWSNLNRTHLPQRRWLGLKAHFACEQLSDTTDLYFFHGGYCGVQPVAPGLLNVCAMVRADVGSTLEQVLARHPRLMQAARGWRPVTDMFATSPLLFRRPTPVRHGTLCAGDAAGFIDPFAGDGIALALRGGVVAANSLCDAAFDITSAALRYARAYQRQFAPGFRIAARLRRLLAAPRFVRAPLLPLLGLATVSEFLVKKTRAA